jgi:cytochrome c-type biogenesis protein
MIDIGVLGAFLGGILSFVSPCVLPLVPPYLCYVAGLSLDELGQSGAAGPGRGRIVLSAFSFVLGFATVFVTLGATASVFGQALARLLTYDVIVFGAELRLLPLLAGLVIIAMGLHFLGAFRIAALLRESRVHVARKPPGLLGGYVLGLAFAFGWTPCIGPVLAAILFLAGAEDTVGQGAFLLLVYSLGLGVPFLLAAAFAPAFLSWLGRFRRSLPTVEKVMGGFLVLTGILFITGRMTTMSFWLLETFPGLATIG